MNSETDRNSDESRPTSRRLVERTAAVLAVSLVLATVAPAGAAAPNDGVTVAQTASAADVSPGGTVSVELRLDATELNAPAVAVTLPEGWTLLRQSAEGPATYKPDTNEWVWLQGGEHAVTYTVSIPDDAGAGNYTIETEGSAIVPDTGDRVVDSARTTVAVAASDRDDASNANAGTSGSGVADSATVTTTENASAEERTESQRTDATSTESAIVAGQQTQTTAATPPPTDASSTTPPTDDSSTTPPTDDSSTTPPTDDSSTTPAERDAETTAETTRSPTPTGGTGATPGFGVTAVLGALAAGALLARR